MKFKKINRHFLSAAIIIFYLAPMLFFAFYSIGLMASDKSWFLLSFGLLLVAIGCLSLILLLNYWEESIRDRLKTVSPAFGELPVEQLRVTDQAKLAPIDQVVTFPFSTSADEPLKLEDSNNSDLLQATIREAQEQNEQLSQDLAARLSELHQKNKEVEELESQVQKITQDFDDYKLFSEEQLKQKQMQYNRLQSSLEDQRFEMEKRQEQIHQLDTKVHDLSYEIKTLLYLHEEEGSVSSSGVSKNQEIQEPFLRFSIPSSEDSALDCKEDGLITEIFPSEDRIRTSTEASHLLKKCIQTAEKLTGANHQTNESSRYREFSSTYYAIDQRRLFDSLRSENSAIILVCTPKELKTLFVNNRVKTLLGWSPEKFVTDFPSIMFDSLNEWKKALLALSGSSESQTRLLAKTKQGKEVLLNTHFGVIPTGLFRNYVIGVLYP